MSNLVKVDASGLMSLMHNNKDIDIPKPFEREIYLIVIKTADGIKIGYVPQMDNLIFSRLMDAGKLLFARIQMKEQRGKWIKIHIKVFLQD